MSRLKDYLEYYKSLSAPGYAVLVTGAWGVGKTYQVKKALKIEDIYYVSLFGLESREAIEAALLTAANPSLIKKKRGLGWSTQKAKDVGGLYTLIGVIPSAINALLKIELDSTKVIVFDDLERCGLEMKVLLGLINDFVEHKTFKVVVIAHDEKLSEEIETQKEKVFGQTIPVEPELYKAFFVFLKEIEGSGFMDEERSRSAAKFIRQNRKLIFSVFQRQTVEGDRGEFHVYEGSSLRVLRRVLFDMARLYSVISEENLQNEDAVSRLITEFCIFDLEYKMGSFPSKTLTEDWGDENNLRHQRQYARQDNDNIPLAPLEILDKKYSQINLDRLLLDSELLSKMIVYGDYDAELLNKKLSQSMRITVVDLPAWRKFMSFDELDDNIVDEAREELLHQFDNREITEIGEMLHMFALRFMKAQNGVIKDSFKKVEQSCKDYIDDLLSKGELPSRPTENHWPSSIRYEASHGYSYWVTDAYRDHFGRVFEYLNDARVKAFENQGNELAERLLSSLSSDVEEFTKLISYRSGGGEYAAIPVLHHIDVNTFVDAWLSLPKSHWQSVRYALNSRYEGGRLQNDEHHIGELADERSWAISLRKLLEARAKKLAGYKGLRISRIIPNIPDS